MSSDFNCRFNLIDGRLVLDHSKQVLAFFRSSLGTEELYASWPFQDIKEPQIQKSLLTQELVILLKSNERLRFSATTVPSEIETWVQHFSTPPKNFSSLQKTSQGNVSVPKNASSTNLQMMEQEPFQSFQPSESKLVYTETSSMETDDSSFEFSEPLENTSIETDASLHSKYYNEQEKSDVPKPKPTPKKQEQKQTSGCCSLVFWLVIISYVLNMLGAC